MKELDDISSAKELVIFHFNDVPQFLKNNNSQHTFDEKNLYSCNKRFYKFLYVSTNYQTCKVQYLNKSLFELSDFGGEIVFIINFGHKPKNLIET